MHELSIALSLLDLAAEQAEQRHARILAIHLKLGPLSGVLPDALLSAYDLARSSSFTPDARLVIEEIPLITYCPACEQECRPLSIQHFFCPVCGTPTPKVIHGRELEVSAMEVIDAESHAASGAGAPAGAQTE